MKKYFAIVLALVMLAAIPLSVSASSAYDSYVIGTWTCYGCYDTETKELSAHSGTTLTMNSNGTCSWYFAGEDMTGSWTYYSSVDTGYAYMMTVNAFGTSLNIAVIYCTTSALNGDLAVSVGDSIYLYQK